MRLPDDAVKYETAGGEVVMVKNWDGPYAVWCIGERGCLSRYLVVRGEPNAAEREDFGHVATGLSYSLVVLPAGAMEFKCPLCGRVLSLR